ncbi:shikimate kinase [Ruminiclostridium cellulolyticum]|uniref:Shikimate kinase n=1 Tax=Ruminiclostridium cellulolyticum (strain ATCC 35319 / DSM 5812 / JCM 6584 / H10) TaxID=394503 RepID=B8I5U0_RUMCH|nr:shikimate kinase [Ruminiclostridium cellulolyticum]ACL74757.1 shikimate kinase [Ruminiclostridium cellulolyticum H10]
MKNIILIGMPSAGKSTVGVIVAKHRGMSFVDTDVLIQTTQGRLLQEILNNDGTDAFLKIEESSVLSLNCSDTVIATGGSAVYSEKAMDYLKRTGTVIYLYVDMETVNKRLKNLKTRGVVLGPGESLEYIYSKRQPLYEKYADIIIDCSETTIDSTVEMIHERLDSLS